ncbi:MAG: nucleotidyltransferase domain-containing protein [Deltaproteobacteria bacterium]|nr:nucleotidyltransferase domain-containing protein [Deltaproteobacteria bacterium]
MVKKTILNRLKKFHQLLLKEGVEVSALVLYGSYARGTAHRDSDIDVCVVSPQFGKDRFEEGVFLRHISGRVHALIEPVPCSLKDYQKNKVSPLLHEIRKEGITVFH